MKNLILTLSALVMLCGCKPDQVNKPDAILLLKVDYQTLKFEGGTEQSVNSISNADTIPLKVEYKAPGDFGSITLYHKPGNELLFKGTIIWMGKGVMGYPTSLNPSTAYPTYNTALPYPGNSTFKPIMAQPPGSGPDFEPIWNAVSNLRIVSEYRKANKKISIFLYTPSVGMGNPADWDWIILMSK
jgi:hypothetical protein